jgi:hypothetical protein
MNAGDAQGTSAGKWHDEKWGQTQHQIAGSAQ